MRVCVVVAPPPKEEGIGRILSAMELAITTERAGAKRWIAHAPEVRATAQGSTKEEAKRNLRALLTRYPDLLDDLRNASDRRVELIKL